MGSQSLAASGLTETPANELKVYFVIASRGRREAPSESEAIQRPQAQAGLLRRNSSWQ
jgi:hypothetical protein